MSSFDDEVGLRFHEELRGQVTLGSVSGAAVVESRNRFRLKLEIEIPSVRGFLEGTHVAAVNRGTVEWPPDFPHATIESGFIHFFELIPNTPRQRLIRYDLRFTDGAKQFSLRGSKQLSNDTGFDAPADLTTLLATVEGEGVLGGGVLSCSLPDWLRSLENAKALRTSSSKEADAARKALLGFLNHELRAVYPDMPLIFSTDDWFSKEQWRILKFLARVMLPDPLPADGPDYHDVIRNIERFVSHADNSEVDRIRKLLQVAGLLLPTKTVEPADLRQPILKMLNSERNNETRRSLDALHSLVHFAYYADRKADHLVGYQRVEHVPKNKLDLRVTAEPPAQEFDVVIAGTGPAGSLIAARMAAAGKSVLLLEAGAYFPEHKISSDEVEGTARLYKNSGMQTTVATPGLPVLQAYCVGGGGVINNAICVPLTAVVFDDWQRAGFSINEADLWAGYSAVAQDLSIGDVRERADFLNPSARHLENALGPIQTPPVDRPLQPGLYRALVNFERRTDDKSGCLSTGLCNVGCGSERKRSAFQVYLRDALNRPTTVLVANARVIRVDLKRKSGGYTATGLRVKLRDGRVAVVRGREYVLSCGPVGSSAVLLRSETDGQDLLARMRLPVGRRFSANIALPLFGVLPTPVHTRPSVQISEVYLPPSGSGYVLETWFSPPGGLAVVIPGYMAEHAQRMQAYTRLVCASPLVGTSPVGRIGLKGDRPTIRLPIEQRELTLMREGTRLIAGAFLQGGATEVIVRCGRGRVARNAAELAQLDAQLAGIGPAEAHLLPITTAHPQGGNALSEDPALGVVDRDFRVRGTDNLRVCDGSVHPAAAGVNPQWTIMALADVCARRILST